MNNVVTFGQKTATEPEIKKDIPMAWLPDILATANNLTGK